MPRQRVHPGSSGNNYLDEPTEPQQLCGPRGIPLGWGVLRVLRDPRGSSVLRDPESGTEAIRRGESNEHAGKAVRVAAGPAYPVLNGPSRRALSAQICATSV